MICSPRRSSRTNEQWQRQVPNDTTTQRQRKRKTIDRKLIEIFFLFIFQFQQCKAHSHRERRIRNSEFLFIISAYPLTLFVCLLLFIGDGGNIWNICCFHLLRLFWMHLSKNSMWLVIALSCLSNNFRSSFRINCHWMISSWRNRNWSRCWHAIGYDFTSLWTARSFLPDEPVSIVIHFPWNETRISDAVELSPIEWDEALTEHFYSVKLAQQSILRMLDVRPSVFIGQDVCAVCLFRMKGKPARERRNGWVSVGLYRWTWSFYSNRDLITNENRIKIKISRDDERLCRGCHCAIPPNSVRRLFDVAQRPVVLDAAFAAAGTFALCHSMIHEAYAYFHRCPIVSSTEFASVVPTWCDSLSMCWKHSTMLPHLDRLHYKLIRFLMHWFNEIDRSLDPNTYRLL